MIDLPNEIVEKILKELRVEGKRKAKRSLTPYALINRQWQMVVERILWSRLAIEVQDLDKFKKYYRPGTARRQTLTCIHITFDEFFTKTFPDDEQQSDGGSDRTDSSDDGSEEENESADTDEEDEEDTDMEDEEDEEDTDMEEDCDEHDQEIGLTKADEKDIAMMESRFCTFQKEHLRFFQEAKLLWDDLASWGEDLKVTQIDIRVNGRSIYELLGPKLRRLGVAHHFLSSNAWHNHPDMPHLPVLPSVTTCVVWAQQKMDLWPAIVVLKLARTFSNIEDLDIESQDLVKTWKYARKYFRQIIATEISTLPLSLRKFQLSLNFSCNLNQETYPPSFCTNGVDVLSRAIGHLSTQLSGLAINVNSLSADLFWVADPFGMSTSGSVLWPNLTRVHIRTGLETATGKYCMRRSDPSLPCYREYYAESPDPDNIIEEELLEMEAGDLPYRWYRVRPNRVYFDKLAIGIARMASCSPMLMSVSLHMSTPLYDQRRRYYEYGFYFRSGNDAIKAQRYIPLPEPYEKAGIDWNHLDHPRTEWVFECPYMQLQWEEPQEAKRLWKDRFPDIDLDVVTQEYDKDTEANRGERRWERRREGVCIDIGEGG